MAQRRTKSSVFFKKKFKIFFAPQIIEKLPKKVAQNPTRPRVFSPAMMFMMQVQ